MESRILKAYGASRIKEEDEDFERSNGPNRPRKRKSEYDEMGKRSKKHTTPTENLKNKKKKNYMAFPVNTTSSTNKKRARKIPGESPIKLGNEEFDPKVIREIEGDIYDEEDYVADSLQDSRKQMKGIEQRARKRARQKLPEVEDHVFEQGWHNTARGIKTVPDAQRWVKNRALKMYNRRRGIKPKKVKNKMGGNNSAIFSGANTINFTKNGDGTDTVTPMGASAQDIKTAYRKASLNA